MSDPHKKNSTQDQAIQAYLQSLLSEVAEETELDIAALQTHKSPDQSVPAVKSEVKIKPDNAKPVAEPKNQPVVVGIEQLVAEVPEVITPAPTEVLTPTEVKPEVVTEVEVDAVTTAQVEQPALLQSVIPEWAESRFQCLLFNVSGLSLAVPLVKLNSVIPWDENITTTPNQTDWYLGLVQHLEYQIKVIDTALLVMPENRRGSIEDDTENRLSHILLVDDYKWGLACSSIGDVIWLNQDEVKWRKNKNSRAWLSGTSLEHLCAIMDTEVFAQMLTKSN